MKRGNVKLVVAFLVCRVTVTAQYARGSVPAIKPTIINYAYIVAIYMLSTMILPCPTYLQQSILKKNQANL